MFRIAVAASFLLMASCSSNDDGLTLCRESIEMGSDPDALVATIDNPQLPGVFVVSERGKTSVGIFQTGTCVPYLQLGDRDSDGVFDLLTYSALSKDGKVLATVEDYGMDGQPDYILDFTNSTASVFYRGSWYPVAGIGEGGEGPTVEIDGNRRSLRDVLEENGRQPF